MVSRNRVTANPVEKSTGTSPTPPKTTAPVQQVPKIERGKAETPVQKPAAGAQTMSAQTPENSGYTTTNEQIWGEGGSGLAGHDQYVEQTKQKLEQDKTAVTPISEAKYENWLKQLGIDPSQYEPGKVVETENGQVHQEGAQRPKTEGTSGADEDLLSGTGYGLIQAFKAEWDRLNELAKEAEAAGNRELAAQYRQQRDLQNTYANQIRAGAGYYGGTDGSMYIPLGQLGAAQGQQSGTVQGQIGTQQGAQSGEGTAMQLRELLSAWQEAAQQQANGQIDYATQQAIRELERALEDAQPQFKEQAESVAIDERQAMDNAALYARLRGDNGGIGQEQYNSIQNTAAQNRLAVQQAQTKLSTDTARQIADLRAQGEFEKADKALEITQQYLSQLIGLEQWAAEYNLSVEQFQAQLSQWEAEYNLSMQQLQMGQSQWEQEFAFQQEQAAIGNQQWQTEFDAAMEQWQKEFDFQQRQTAIDNSQWAQEFALQQEKYRNSQQQENTIGSSAGYEDVASQAKKKESSDLTDKYLGAMVESGVISLEEADWIFRVVCGYSYNQLTSVKYGQESAPGIKTDPISYGSGNYSPVQFGQGG